MLLRIKVKPNSKTDGIMPGEDGILKVKIKAAPVDGKANKYLLEYLSQLLKLPKSSISLKRGDTNSFKTIEIDAAEEEVKAKLQKILE